jgi:ribosomal protein S18 acetylase RimI-like enzyme
MSTITLRHLAAEPAREGFIPAVLPWVLEAGNPYFDWFFGREEAPGRIERWMLRPSSEVAIGRAVVAELDGSVVGGYVAVQGRELPTCRIADAVAALAEAGKEAGALRARMETARDLFPAVSADDLYLSKLGLLHPYRGRGFARQLVARFLEQGCAQGFSRFRLDVFARNDRAIRLYRLAGFDVVSEAIVPGTSLGYLAMALRC